MAKTGPKPKPIKERFEKFFTKAEGCWIWKGQIGQTGSYGVFSTPKKDAKGWTHAYAHRMAYELYIGPIPDGMTLDHTCHTNSKDCPGGNDCLHRRCINPAHLEPVPFPVNLYRGQSLSAQNYHKTNCKRGHPFDSVNTYIASDGARQCRICRRMRSMKYKASKSGEAGRSAASP